MLWGNLKYRTGTFPDHILGRLRTGKKKTPDGGTGRRKVRPKLSEE